MSILNFIVLLPLLAAIGVLLGAPARRTALGVSALNLLLTLIAFFNYHPDGARYQLQWSFPISKALDFKYYVGADGLTLVMLLLTSVVTLAAVWVTPAIAKMEGRFYACLLFIAAGATGAFASLDLFFFYAFHELALIPTFLLIGIWGSGDRRAAAWKITIYLALGSFILLIGLIGLHQALPAEMRTLDIPLLQLRAAAITTTSANTIYLFLLLGFGILVSLFPFHTWAPSAYASAPAPAAMLHAGVLKKFGLYGLLRVALPLLPEAAKHWTNLLLILLVGNIIYVGLVTIAQKRLDLMLGYSSVMHMGYIFLGIATFSVLGVSGAVLLMLAHGLSIAALFALNGELRERTQTLNFADLGGLGKVAPTMSFLFGLAAFASLGLPGFGNFAAELMIFFAAFGSFFDETYLRYFQIATIAALWGVVISAVYILRAYRATFLGEMNKRWEAVRDLAGPIRWPLALLLGTLLLAGCWPGFFLKVITPSVKALLAQ